MDDLMKQIERMVLLMDVQRLSGLILMAGAKAVKDGKLSIEVAEKAVAQAKWALMRGYEAAVAGKGEEMEAAKADFDAICAPLRAKDAAGIIAALKEGVPSWCEGCSHYKDNKCDVHPKGIIQEAVELLEKGPPEPEEMEALPALEPPKGPMVWN